MPAARSSFKRIAQFALAASLSSVLAGCQYQSAGDLLFKPTLSYGDVPQTYNTPYDCRSFEGQGWKGTVGGKYSSFDQTRNLTRVGCFKTLPECKAFLGIVGGQVQMIIYSRCEEIGA